MKTSLLLLFLMSISVWASVPDYRPKFDKSSYKKTLWTQVNPWWLPAKQRVDDLGGPNYARKKHPLEKQWGSAMSDSYQYGRLNWQVELHVSAPGFANTMKRMIKEARELGINTKFSIFLVYYGKKNLSNDIKKTIYQLNMLKDELKSDPAIFRVDGAPVISVYTPRYLKPEEWGKLIPEVEKKCGKFIWLFNTCVNPTIDSDMQKGGKWVREYLPYFDGVSQYGNYSKTSQEAHYKWLAEIMHKEYPHKIFEVSVQNAYSNHFHFGGVSTKLSEKWRKSLRTAIKANPDSIVYTNFFDHYENSLVLPCYEREDFLLRYGEYSIAKWRGEKFSREKKPELVLTNYTTIMLGSNALDFEVICFPINSKFKSVEIMLDICNTSGEILHTFPTREVLLKDSVKVLSFSIPSENFHKERGIVPRLRYRWIGRDFELNYNPMTLLSPSLRSNLMFWARSTKNTLLCKIVDREWRMCENTSGQTLKYPKDGIVSTTSMIAPMYGSSPRNGSSCFRIMRNGLELYSFLDFKSRGMNFTRAFIIPSPADSLNWYHLEIENAKGYRYQTLPIWVTNNRRPGKVKIPMRCGGKIRELEIEAANVPYFYYPCNTNDGALLVDHSGYFHNGCLNGKGYGGGHLGYTGYYHYHNGPMKPIKNTCFTRDKDGRGFLKFRGEQHIMIMGGTAFPGASTYELSVRPQKIGKTMGIIGTANNQINLTLEPDGRLKLQRGAEKEGEGGAKNKIRFTSKIFSKEKLKVGEWYRIVAVYDLKKFKLYVNGILQGEVVSPPRAYHAWINNLTVGSSCAWVWKPYNKFIGDIREIRLYGRNLSPSEFLK